MAHMYRQPPSHLAKDSVKRIPFVGNIAEIVGCLFINRSSKDEKRDMFTQLKDRQAQIE